MSMDKNERQMNEVLESALNSEKRPLPEQLRNRLIAIPNQTQHTMAVVPKFQVWAFAAGLAVLVTVNAFALQKTRKNDTATVEVSPYTEYFSHYNSI
jgi:hypothetical protein